RPVLVRTLPPGAGVRRATAAVVRHRLLVLPARLAAADPRSTARRGWRPRPGRGRGFGDLWGQFHACVCGALTSTFVNTCLDSVVSRSIAFRAPRGRRCLRVSFLPGV